MQEIAWYCHRQYHGRQCVHCGGGTWASWYCHREYHQHRCDHFRRGTWAPWWLEWSSAECCQVQGPVPRVQLPVMWQRLHIQSARHPGRLHRRWLHVWNLCVWHNYNCKPLLQYTTQESISLKPLNSAIKFQTVLSSATCWSEVACNEIANNF